MVISLAMILILIAILIFGLGFYRFAPVSPNAKNWIMLVLFLIATLVVLYYAGALRIR